MRRAPLAIGITLILSHQAVSGECSDVLRYGSFSKTEIINSHTLRELLLRKYASEESSDIKKQGFNADIINDVSSSFNYNNDESSSKKLVADSLNFNRYISNIDAYTTISGDPIIVGAWKECMSRNLRGKGGLVAYFTTPSKTEAHAVYLNIEYHSALGVNSATIEQDILLPSYARFDKPVPTCVKKNHSINDSNPCIAKIVVDSPWRTLSLVIKTHLSGGPTGSGATATAYLPPRIEQKRIESVYNPPEGSSLYTIGYGSKPERQIKLSNDLMLSADQINEGIRFDPVNSIINLKTETNSDHATCVDTGKSIEQSKIHYSALWDSSDTGAYLTCRFVLDLKTVKNIWVGVDGSLEPFSPNTINNDNSITPTKNWYIENDN